MKTPNFFIIGAPKCGTTSMAAWLAEHSNVYMSPVKEPSFFCSDISPPGCIQGRETYLRLFQDASPREVRRGEATTTYLFSRVAVPTIERELPGARYIVLLRHPVEMAYSLHDQLLRDFYENIHDFEQAWKLVPDRRSGRHITPDCPAPIRLDYPAWCLLGKQLQRLYSVVSRERVLVLLMDDVRENPRREYLKVLDFLGLLDDGRRDFPVHNATREWRWQAPVRMIHKVRGQAGRLREAMGVNGLGLKWLVRSYERLNEAVNARDRPRPPLSAQFRKELTVFFAEDVRLLERLLKRDLSAWLEVTIHGDS